MIHTYSLIHDDLPSMDNDDARRGRPTCHKKFGDGVAILAGDALLALAFEVLAKDVTPAMSPRLAVQHSPRRRAPTALVGGQCDDIRELELASGSRELLESIHNRKTGGLFLASLRLGGLVAGASQSELDALREFGSNLGLAFQITDDLLDVREDRRGAATKKKSDWGKLTFPNLIGEKQSRADVAKLVTAACEALKPLGTNARSLQALATFVSERI